MAEKIAGVHYWFLVVGDRCWGKSATEAGAVKVAKKNYPAYERHPFNTHYKVYLVPPDAFVDDMGAICWHDVDDEIILLKEVKNGKVQEPSPAEVLAKRDCDQ